METHPKRNSRTPHGLELTIVVTTDELEAAFARRLAPLENAQVVRSWWEEMDAHDCFVTAGNSYGIMNAGIDAVVVEQFGPAIQESVQTRILDEYLGEQPVGTAFILPTGNSRVPYLCHAPTMRVRVLLRARTMSIMPRGRPC